MAQTRLEMKLAAALAAESRLEAQLKAFQSKRPGPIQPVSDLCEDGEAAKNSAQDEEVVPFSMMMRWMDLPRVLLSPRVLPLLLLR